MTPHLPHHRVRPHLRRGFTLIEAVTVITAMGALGTIAASIIVNAARGYAGAVTRAEVAADGATALDRVWRELLGVPIKTGYPSVAPDITTLTASSITWNTNYTLTLTGTNLTLSEAGGTARVLLSNVSALTIQAYDESNAALAASLSGAGCDPIRRLSVQVTVTRSGLTETFRTRVFLRGTMSGASG